MPKPLVAFPCASISTSNTFLSSNANEAPKLMVVVVLPTPPFWFATAIILPIIFLHRTYVIAMFLCLMFIMVFYLAFLPVLDTFSVFSLLYQLIECCVRLHSQAIQTFQCGLSAHLRFLELSLNLLALLPLANLSSPQKFLFLL